MATKPIESLTNGEKTTVRGHLKAVGSDTTAADAIITGSATQVLNTIALTQAQYDEIVTPDTQTNYLITDAPEPQPLDTDLTAYANAADAAVRRALIGAAAAVITNGTYSQISTPPPDNVIGSLKLFLDVEIGSELCWWNGTHWISSTTGAIPSAGL